jgi:hypothetical protein
MPSGAVAIPDAVSARLVARKFQLPAGELRALSLIDDASRIIIDVYRKQLSKTLDQIASPALTASGDRAALLQVLQELTLEFPPAPMYDGLAEPGDWLESSTADKGGSGRPHRELAIEQFVLIRLFNENPACGPYRILFDDGVSPAGATSPGTISAKTPYLKVFARLEEALKTLLGSRTKREKPLISSAF